MKKRFGVFAAVFAVVTVCIFTGCCASTEETAQLKVEVVTQMDYWEQMDLSDTRLSEKEELTELAQDYLVQIAQLLGDEKWWLDIKPDADTLVLHVDLSDTPLQSFNSGQAQPSGDSQLYSGVTLSVGFYKDGGLAHELTHIIGVGYSGEFSAGLTEGLCDYAQTQVGEVLYHKEWDFQDYLSVLMKNEIEYSQEGRNMIYELLEHVGSSEQGCPYGQGYEMLMWYNMNHSFVRYLIDKYGMGTVRDFIRRGTDESSYEEYFDKTYAELKEEWFSYMLSYDNQITIEDIMEYMRGRGMLVSLLRTDELTSVIHVQFDSL